MNRKIWFMVAVLKILNFYSISRLIDFFLLETKIRQSIVLTMAHVLALICPVCGMVLVILTLLCSYLALLRCFINHFVYQLCVGGSDGFLFYSIFRVKKLKFNRNSDLFPFILP